MENVERTSRQRVPSAMDALRPWAGADLQRLGFFGAAFGLIFGFGGLIPFFMMKGNFLLKLTFLGFSFGGFAVLATRQGAMGGIASFFLIISFLVIIAGLFLYCMRPDLAITIKNKGALEQSPPISIRRSRQFGAWRQDTGTGYSEVMPTSESEGAIREITAIINDIQKLGDHGVNKWITK